jgi:hypothetical protein
MIYIYMLCFYIIYHISYMYVFILVIIYLFTYLLIYLVIYLCILYLQNYTVRVYYVPTLEINPTKLCDFIYKLGLSKMVDASIYGRSI